MLLNNKKSVLSKNKKGFADFELKQSAKPIIYENIVGKINAMEVFNNERLNSDNYRLIFTINPYCTNILFNAITEIIKNEGSNNPIVVTDEKTVTINNDNKCIYGINEDIERSYMIQNTEYSKNDIGFKYKPGYDFFNNHILRNKSFKMVCKNKFNDDINVFNTINDYMRYQNSDKVKFRNREDISDNLSKYKFKHLYNFDDIIPFDNGDAINENLKEINGWFGFKNKSSIDSKYTNDKNSIDKIEYLNIHRALNDKDRGEFIDMYPDRGLYTFSPNLNKFKNRLEENWEYCITYPYENYFEHDLINGNGINGLKIMEIYKGKSQIGSDVIYLRFYCKHGLSRNDHFNLYIENILIRKDILVMNLGDEYRKNEEYYIYTADLSLLDDILSYDIDNDKSSNILEDFEYDGIINSYDNIRVIRTVGGIESKYYFRIFKKLPNFKFSKKEFTEEISKNKDKYNEFIKENACDNEGNMYLFTSEKYKLGFSSTIYSDNTTQITYTDDLNIENIVDNLGRPITELYMTIIKTNKGHEKWYEFDDFGFKNPIYGDDDIEFSHCFGNVSSGIEISNKKEDEYNTDYIIKKAKQSDIHYLNNIKSKVTNLNMFNSEPLEDDIKINNEIFKNYKYGYLKTNTINTEIINDDKWGYSDYISIIGSKSITFNNGFGIDANKCIEIYDINKNRISYYSYEDSDIKTISTKDENMYYVRVSFYINSNTESFLRNENNELLWEPVINNTNLNYKNGYLKYNDTLNTEIVNDSEWAYSDYINIVGIDDIEINNGFGVDENKCIEFYDRNKNKIHAKSYEENPKTIYENEYKGSFYLRYCFYKKNINSSYIKGTDYKKNLWKPLYHAKEFKNYEFGYLKTNSKNTEIVNDNEWAYTNYIFIDGIDEIELNNGFGIDANKCIEFYDNDRNRIDYVPYSNSNYDMSLKQYKIIVPEGSIFIRFSFYYKGISNVYINGIDNDSKTEERLLWKPINKHKKEIDKDCFFGDLCEYNSYEVKEKVLNEVFHRFNTAQREIIDKSQSKEFDNGHCIFYSNEKYDDFEYYEIISDDYDRNGFKTMMFNINNRNYRDYFYYIHNYDLQSTIRPEGYIYKPHYKIQVRDFGKINQMSHNIIRVKKAEPVQARGILIRLFTKVNHYCNVGDTIYLTINDKWYKTNVVYVESKSSIIINRIPNEVFGITDWLTLCDGINNNNISVYRHNINIPNYAINVGTNMFLWRDIIKPGSEDSILTKDYIFTNGAFYINKEINFYLKRQDSNNKFGIQARYIFPNDINGNIKKTSNYVYKEEKDILC